MYTGSNKETTREFCEQLTRKKFIHKSEIPEILKGRIDEYQCAIYEKTGLPYGMIEGTTPENFQCNCGGWNCRHQLVPVHELAVPANIRAKFKQIRPTNPEDLQTQEPQKRQMNDEELQALKELNDRRVEAKKKIPADRKTVKQDHESLFTRHLVCTKKDIKNILSHCKNDDEIAVALEIDRYLPTLSNGQYEKLIEKDNTPGKIARGVKYYVKYTFVADDGHTYLLKCEAIKRERDPHLVEHPYFLKKM
jgi:hypothetical protein